MEYIAFIHKEDDAYVAVVPDLGYTSSFSSTFTGVVHNIVEACELYAEDESELPIARSLEKLMKDESLESNAAPQLINVKVEKNVRINVMLPAGLLRAVNTRADEVYQGNRSAYIQDLMQRDISI